MEFLSPPTTPKRAFRSRGDSLSSAPSHVQSSTRSNLLFLQDLDADIDASFSAKNSSLLDAESRPTTLTISLVDSSSFASSPARVTSPTAYTSTPPRTPRSGNVASPYNSSCGTPIKTPDRFIPNRANIDFDICNSLLSPQAENEEAVSDAKMQYKNAILRAGKVSLHERLINVFENNRVFEDIIEQEPLKNRIVSIASDMEENRSVQGQRRVVPVVPSRILDAPGLVDDYYLNLLSWGSNNIVAVGLGKCVYTWNASNEKVDLLLTLPDATDSVTSLQWNPKDNVIAVGTHHSAVQLWDAATMTKLRDLDGHSARVSCLSWNGQNVISSGGRDSSILNRDLREPPSSTSFGTFNCHIHEVCGLAWSPDGKTLASGGNDNMLCLWDAAISNSNVGRVSLGGRSSIGSIGSSFNDLNPRRSYLVGSHSPRNIIRDHTAAVKALAWCPFQRNVLASGGGTADRCIRIRNTDTNSVLHCVNTGSQVCALQWSDEYRELVSSHGFSDNQLILWKYPSMTKLREFHGHASRVLHLAKSPDGCTVLSGAADETLRFWDMFKSAGSSSRRSSGGSGSRYSMGSKGSGGARWQSGSKREGIHCDAESPFMSSGLMLR